MLLSWLFIKLQTIRKFDQIWVSKFPVMSNSTHKSTLGVCFQWQEETQIIEGYSTWGVMAGSLVMEGGGWLLNTHHYLQYSGKDCEWFPRVWSSKHGLMVSSWKENLITFRWAEFTILIDLRDERKQFLSMCSSTIHLPFQGITSGNVQNMIATLKCYYSSQVQWNIRQLPRLQDFSFSVHSWAECDRKILLKKKWILKATCPNFFLSKA